MLSLAQLEQLKANNTAALPWESRRLNPSPQTHHEEYRQEAQNTAGLVNGRLPGLFPITAHSLEANFRALRTRRKQHWQRGLERREAELWFKGWTEWNR